jgi:hypothetical protein
MRLWANEAFCAKTRKPSYPDDPNGRLHDKRRLSTYGVNVLSRDGRWCTANRKSHRLNARVGQLSKAGRNSWQLDRYVFMGVMHPSNIGLISHILLFRLSG